jgi:energy-coupling factor transporter transmembrane protein EcfT
MNNDNLQSTLSKLIQSGSRSNPAMNTLINDYTEHHVVLVVVGGFFVLIFFLLCLFFWTQFKRTPQTAKHKWSFEKKTYFSLGVVSIVVGLLIALIVAVNATTVLNPLPGFSSLVDSLGTPKAGTQMDKLYQAFNTWLQSGSTHIPSLIQSKIDERLAWQRPKAIVSGVLLVVFVALSTCLCRTLLKKSRVRESTWGLKERALLVCGAATITLSLLLMVIVIANMQGAFAPITLTLAFG